MALPCNEVLLLASPPGQDPAALSRKGRAGTALPARVGLEVCASLPLYVLWTRTTSPDHLHLHIFVPGIHVPDIMKGSFLRGRREEWILGNPVDPHFSMNQSLPGPCA